MTIDARGVGPFQGVRSVAFSVTQPVRDTMSWVARPVRDTWQGAVHYDELAEENDELRRRVAELEGRIDGLPDTEVELSELRAAVDIDDISDLDSVVARVVADRRTSLERVVEIDRGSDDGLRVGMPVVVGDGLVGRLELVTGSRSQILLITDPRFPIGVVSKGTRALGVATGNGDGLPLDLDIEEGGRDVVVDAARFETSGSDRSIYPGGLPVGRLAIESDGTFTIEPSADLDRLSFVSVLLTPETEDS